jgi:putative transcriptional regulator
MRTVAETPIFIKYAAEVWSAEARGEFIGWIAANPQAGDLNAGSGSCRKVRWATACQPSSCLNSRKEFKMRSDLDRFQKDILTSVKQMRQGNAGCVTKVVLPPAAEARARVGLSQQEFASLLGVSARTLQDWEQGRREPTGAAKTLLRVAVAHPDILRELQS